MNIKKYLPYALSGGFGKQWDEWNGGNRFAVMKQAVGISPFDEDRGHARSNDDARRWERPAAADSGCFSG